MDFLSSNKDKDQRSDADPDIVESSATFGSQSRSTPESCRETLKINHEEQAFHNHLTLGIQEKLQKNRMIKNVKLQFKKPVDKHALSLWERKNGVSLPNDLKEYYQSTNGFKLTWCLEHAGDILPIGEMNINSLNQLVEIHAAAKQNPVSMNSAGNRSGTIPSRPKTSSTDNTSRQSLSSGHMSASSRKQQQEVHQQDQNGDALQLPYAELEQTLVGAAGFIKMPISGLIYTPDTKMFILDSGRSGWGKVCLVYPSPPSVESPISQSSFEKNTTQSPRQKASSETSAPYIEVWFMDPSFQWHFLAPTFTHFYRMLLFHQGLPQWHYRFTPFGLSSWAEQMFWLVAPHLLPTPKLSKFPSLYYGEGLWCTDVPSEAATPNPTVNTLSNQLFRRKKKDKEKF